MTAVQFSLLNYNIISLELDLAYDSSAVLTTKLHIINNKNK